MWKNSNIIVNCIENCFQNIPQKSNVSKSISERENNPEQFIKRVTPQIIESYYQGWLLGTPEEWDTIFNNLGGGQSRRRSSIILKRMSWEQFLYNAELIIKEYKENLNEN